MNFFELTSYILKMALRKKGDGPLFCISLEKGDSPLFGEQIIEFRFNYLNQNKTSGILHFHNQLIINKLKK
jgi:hypothetical protein